MNNKSVRMLLFALILFLVSSLVACTAGGSIGNTPDGEATAKPRAIPHEQPYQEFMGVSIIIENVSSHQIEYRYENRYGYDVLLGGCWAVYSMNGNEVGEPVEFINPYIIVLILSPLSENNPYIKRTFDFDYYYGGLEPGRYRFQRHDFYISDDMVVPWGAKDIHTDFEIVTLYVDFEI